MRRRADEIAEPTWLDLTRLQSQAQAVEWAGGDATDLWASWRVMKDKLKARPGPYDHLRAQLPPDHPEYKPAVKHG